MKIGILTLPIAENYGGILQAVALSQYLTQAGHDVTLIYKKTQPTFWKETIKKILLAIPFHNLFNVKNNAKINKGITERIKFHKDFINQEIPKISPIFSTSNELAAYAIQQNFDAVIVGSDQVWRKAYINDKHYLSYFLKFIQTPNTKKIAYAASFGKDHWEGKNDTDEISQLLRQFNAISVREASGIDICKETFMIDNTQHVLDPTLLMDKQFYLDIIEKYNLSNTQPKKLVTYVLDEADNKKEIIQHYQNKMGISNEEAFHLKGFRKSNDTPSIPEWLASISSADFIITDSFHGMVFAIIFEKNFVVIGNSDRGIERFTSLLSILELEKNLISPTEKPQNIDNINYQIVQQKIENIRNISINFLSHAIHFDTQKVEG